MTSYKDHLSPWKLQAGIVKLFCQVLEHNLVKVYHLLDLAANWPLAANFILAK